MKSKRVVIALGGNALEEKGREPTADEQLRVIRRTARQLASISAAGYEMVIVHGNGPQVGRILLASELAGEVTPPMPFDVCGAMSQGYIGYQLQQAMKQALEEAGRGHIPVVTIITQTIVSADDPAFRTPTKPIGSFYRKAEAEKLTAEKGWVMREDAGRGYRRMVPSPQPIEIPELSLLHKLWDSTIVIMCGGGGIPVIRESDGRLRGTAAVVDKDLAAALLADRIGADILLILTDVDYVKLHYGTSKEKSIRCCDVSRMQDYMKEGHFSSGSMGPKVEAAVRFAKGDEKRIGIITSMQKAFIALTGEEGTRISNKQAISSKSC